MSRRSDSCRRKQLLAPLLVLFLAAGLLAAGCGSSEETLTIDDVKLEADDMPGWSLAEEVKATPENAAPKSIVKQLYDAGAIDILNQVFERDGRRLQVNYVEMEDTAGGRQAEAMLEAAVGGTNYIGHDKNIAIELIGTVPDMGLAANKLRLSL